MREGVSWPTIRLVKYLIVPANALIECKLNVKHSLPLSAPEFTPELGRIWSRLLPRTETDSVTAHWHVIRNVRGNRCLNFV